MRSLERTASCEQGEGWVLRVRGVDELLPVSRRQLQVVRQALGEP
jgi:two-component system response regulator AlgR